MTVRVTLASMRVVSGADRSRVDGEKRRTFSVSYGRSSQIGMFKKFCAPMRPAALGRRHGPNPSFCIADRVSVVYGQAGAADGAMGLGEPIAEDRDSCAPRLPPLAGDDR